MAENSGNLSVLKISGAPTTLTAEATTLITTGLVYQITNAVKQVLDIATPPTVLVGGSAVSASTYSINYLNGKITFTSSATRTVTVTGKYLPMSVAGYATNMSDSRNVEILDVSAFGDTHKTRVAGLKSASGTLTQLDITDTTYVTALTAGLPIVLENRTLAADEPNRYWVLLENSEIQAAVDGVQNQTVSWISKDEWIRLGL